MVSEIKDMYFKLYRGKGAEASVASEAAGSCTSPKAQRLVQRRRTLDHIEL
jgi:hypothetical protein